MQLAQTVRRAARLEPNRIALVDGAMRLDWRAFEDRVARIASGLRALGVGEGDRVAMLAHNSGRYVEFFFAVVWAGGSHTRVGFP